LIPLDRPARRRRRSVARRPGRTRRSRRSAHCPGKGFDVRHGAGSENRSKQYAGVPTTRRSVLKRLTLGIVTALAMLIAAGSAFAAIDTYSGGYSFSGKAGSKSSPAPLNFTQHFSLKAANAGSLTGILNKVTTSISGVKVDATGFPTCSASHVNSWNKSRYAA